jgi:hypothetical protein
VLIVVLCAGSRCPAQGSDKPAPGGASLNETVQTDRGLNPCEVQEKNEFTPTTPYVRSITDDVTVVVRDLDACLKAEGSTAFQLRLALDGTTLPKLLPTMGPSGQNYLKFSLRIDPYDREDRARWAKIIRAMRRSEEGVSITLANGKTGQVFPSAHAIVINLYPGYTPLVVAGLAVLLIGMLVLGYRSNMLRDNPGDTHKAGMVYPFSLGRVQMAFWFYLVVAGYLYIWLLTGQSYTPTGSVLALLGISSATGFAAAIVDRNKNAEASGKRSDLEIQHATLQSRIAEIEAAHPPAGSDLASKLGEKKDEAAAVGLRLASTPRPVVSKSAGIFKDLFCDGDGVSFHRFQIIVWTIVLGVVFVNAVQLDLAMPDFDAALLGLMGLSSGTYIGFKFPEKSK